MDRQNINRYSLHTKNSTLNTVFEILLVHYLYEDLLGAILYGYKDLM